MEVKLIFMVLIMISFLAIMTGILLHFYGSVEYKLDSKVDVRYACVKYNESSLNTEKIKILVYGFLTGQCDFIIGKLEHRLTFQDLKGIVGEISEDILVLERDACKLPRVNTHSVYFYPSGGIERGESINMTKRQVLNGDVIICEV